MTIQPHAGLLTIKEAAAEAGVSIKVILAELVARARPGYGRNWGQGSREPIPPQHFDEPTTRLPAGKRYATDAEIKRAETELEALKAGRASQEEIKSWWNEGFGHLPPDAVWPNYVEQELDRCHLSGDLPQIIDTWIDVKNSIIYVDEKPRWTDVRVDRVTDTSAVIKASGVRRKRGPGTPTAAGKHQAVKPGPRTEKREKAAEEMQAAIDAGKMRPDQLAQAKQESLAAEYRVSRGTAVKARADVLSKYNSDK